MNILLCVCRLEIPLHPQFSDIHFQVFIYFQSYLLPLTYFICNPVIHYSQLRVALFYCADIDRQGTCNIPILYCLLHIRNDAIVLYLSLCKGYLVIRSSHSLSSGIRNVFQLQQLAKDLYFMKKKNMIVKYVKYKEIF